MEMMESPEMSGIVGEVRHVIEQAQSNVAREVNTELLAAYWSIGRIIVEHEQQNNDRAAYGKQTLRLLARELTKEFGKGFSRSNLQNMRLLYLKYPICQTVSGKLTWSHYCELLSIQDFHFLKVDYESST